MPNSKQRIQDENGELKLGFQIHRLEWINYTETQGEIILFSLSFTPLRNRSNVYMCGYVKWFMRRRECLLNISETKEESRSDLGRFTISW